MINKETFYSKTQINLKLLTLWQQNTTVTDD